ncbi:MAG: hypothetical protein HOP10_03160 [Chitinophagaceae bacterium]|nr:hypothetical protein [Chitinophagaceae bacterium]
MENQSLGQYWLERKRVQEPIFIDYKTENKELQAYIPGNNSNAFFTGTILGLILGVVVTVGVYQFSK